MSFFNFLDIFGTDFLLFRLRTLSTNISEFDLLCAFLLLCIEVLGHHTELLDCTPFSYNRRHMGSFCGIDQSRLYTSAAQSSASDPLQHGIAASGKRKRSFYQMQHYFRNLNNLKLPIWGIHHLWMHAPKELIPGSVDRVVTRLQLC